MASAGSESTSPGATRWVIGGVAVVFLAGLGIWAGTQSQVAAVRVADMEFLDSHGGKPGVVTTRSGLQYNVIREGEGPRPARDDVVLVHYEGRLIDGTVFDSSYQRGQPAAFPLDQVIPGWTEGVQLMPTGAKYHFVVPPDLAYGPRGAGGVIPPGAVLEFDIELLAIRPAE